MSGRIRKNIASFKMYQQQGGSCLTTILTRFQPALSENKENGYATLSSIDRNAQNYPETLRITKREKSPSPPPKDKVPRSRWFMYLLVVFYVVLPLWFSYCPWIRRQIIFLNNINFEFYHDLTAPEKFGFPCAKYFKIETDQGGHLGAWHIPPQSVAKTQLCYSCSTNCTIQDLDFSSDRPIFLYFHGTGFSRSAFFRRTFYKMLSTSSIDAHVVAFDPRGYADSSPGTVTISSLLEDSTAAYKWLRKRVANPDRIVIWGHSMGSGVAVQLAHKYAGTKEQPKAVILESTFTNMVDAVNSFPFSALHRFWPCFEHHIAQKTGNHKDTYIANDEKIAVAVASSILILHSEDDNFLWVEQARKLFHLGNRAVDDNRDKGLIRPRYVEFEAKMGYGHKAFEDPQIPRIVNGFLDDVRRHANLSSF